MVWTCLNWTWGLLNIKKTITYHRIYQHIYMIFCRLLVVVDGVDPFLAGWQQPRMTTGIERRNGYVRWARLAAAANWNACHTPRRLLVARQEASPNATYVEAGTRRRRRESLMPRDVTDMRVGSGRAGGDFVICAFTHAILFCYTGVPFCPFARWILLWPIRFCVSRQQFVKWETHLLVVVVMPDIAFSKVKQQ